MTCKICGKPLVKTTGNQKMHPECVKEYRKQFLKSHRHLYKKYNRKPEQETKTVCICPKCRKKHIVTGKVDRAKRVYCEKHEYLRAA